jgi:hypothetical protein
MQLLLVAQANAIAHSGCGHNWHPTTPSQRSGTLDHRQLFRRLLQVGRVECAR